VYYGHRRRRTWTKQSHSTPLEGESEAGRLPGLVAVSALSVTRLSICYHSTIYNLLHQSTPTSNVMKWRKFLHIPKKHRRERSKARSEIGSVEGQSGVDLAVPRPTESTPDLGIGASTLSTSSPLVPRDQELNGRQTTLSWVILLTSLAVQHRPSHRFRSSSIRPRKRPKWPPRISRPHR